MMYSIIIFWYVDINNNGDTGMNKTKFITIRVEEELYNKFKILVKSNLLNGAAVIRDLLRNYMGKKTLI